MNAFLRNVVWDLRALRRNRVAWVGVCIIVCACALAMKQGLVVANAWQTQANDAQSAMVDSLSALSEKPPQGAEAVATTLFMQRPALVLPPAPLVDLATGRSDLDPKTGKAAHSYNKTSCSNTTKLKGLSKWLWASLIWSLSFNGCSRW